jgi:pilus assembly protein CpaB
MNKKAIVPLVLGLGIGLLAVKFGIDAIRKAQASGAETATVSVVKAKQDINAFDEIQPNMIEVVEVADSPFISAGERIGDLEGVIGRVAGKAIPKGAPVLASMLSPEGTPAGIQGRIKPGFRAVSVKIDEVSSTSYQLRPGNFVDVTVVMDILNNNATARNRKETVSEVILQRIEVASIGYGTQGGTEKKPGKAKPAKSATLFVHKDDVSKLHLAQTRGKLALALRGPDDQDNSTVARATGDGLMGGPKVDEDKQNMLAQMLAMMGGGKDTAMTNPQHHVEAQPKEPPPPHGVLVFHHTSIQGDETDIEQLLFENAESTKLLSVQLGAPTRAAAAMRQDKQRSTGS